MNRNIYLIMLYLIYPRFQFVFPPLPMDWFSAFTKAAEIASIDEGTGMSIWQNYSLKTIYKYTCGT